MSSPNDMFSAILNDPDAMQKIAGIASELMGSTSSADPPASTAMPSTQSSDPIADLMQQAIPALSMLAQNNQNNLNSDRYQLLCALKPFLSSRTCEQIDHAAHLLSMARMARTATGQLLPQLYNKGGGMHV